MTWHDDMRRRRGCYGRYQRIWVMNKGMSWVAFEGEFGASAEPWMLPFVLLNTLVIRMEYLNVSWVLIGKSLSWLMVLE